MKIIRAEHLGMCFGVRDAIALAVETAGREPLTILGDLVHNETVLADLRGRGIRFEGQPAGVGTSTVMITAHGTSERALNEARQRGLNVLEATCPLVRVAHRSLARLVGEGYHPVVIGQREHAEVRGLTGVVAQTTQPIDRVRELVQLLRARFPRSEVRLIDTVCQPTKQRQSAAIELAKQCDVVMVIGGRHSNNTHELVRTCSQFCRRVEHIRTAAELREEWFADAETIGITAGTSTPDGVINEVEAAISAIAVNSGKFSQAICG